MATFAELHGDVPDIQPINLPVYQGTSPEWLAAVNGTQSDVARVDAEEARPAPFTLFDCTCFACGHQWVSDGLAPECAACGDDDIDCLHGTPESEGGIPVPVTRFCIDTQDKANWFLRKLANIDAERRRVQAQTESILAGLNREEEGLRARFEAELVRWTQAELERRGGKGKTLKLHQGNLSFRNVPASLKVASVAEAIEYAKSQGWEAVKVVEALDTAAYKREAEAARAESGELLPGVELTPGRVSFSIKFGPSSGFSKPDSE